jgi:FecR protein
MRFFVMANTVAPTGVPIVPLERVSEFRFKSIAGEGDMCKRNFVHALSLTILFALQATSSHAQEAIGKATSVRPQAEGSHAGPLSGGSNVYSKETVRTGQAGQVDLQFKDNSNLKVGANSSVHLDKFVYDPNKSTGEVAIQATRGTFRFVTGSLGSETYKIKTPYGTLGVRG